MKVTPDHPIYVDGRGWVEAEDVVLGDRLRRRDGEWTSVLAIERVVLAEPEWVYNLTVAGVHTYFVLEVGVLVHNCSPRHGINYTGPQGGFRNTHVKSRDAGARAMGEYYALGGQKRSDALAFFDGLKAKYLDNPYKGKDYAPTLEDMLKSNRLEAGQDYIYAIDLRGNIRLYLEGELGPYPRHSFLVKGENVYGAGHMTFERTSTGWRVDTINASSGHYHDSHLFGSKFQPYLGELLQNLNLPVSWGDRF